MTKLDIDDTIECCIDTICLGNVTLEHCDITIRDCDDIMGTVVSHRETVLSQ